VAKKALHRRDAVGETPVLNAEREQMKRTLFVAITALSLIGITPLCSAQKQADMQGFSSKLESTLVKLDAIYLNINDMIEGLGELEYGAANNAENSIERTASKYNLVWFTSMIAGGMIDARDYKIVLGNLKISCKAAKITGDRAVQSINKNIVRITSNALIAEMTKARDLIQSLSVTQLCDSQ
jgi:hypothetical protein